MANNIFGSRANGMIARITKPLSEIFNSSEVLIVYELGDTVRSWAPGRAINAISGIVQDRSYYVVAKVTMDRSAEFIPPITWNTTTTSSTSSTTTTTTVGPITTTTTADPNNTTIAPSTTTTTTVLTTTSTTTEGTTAPASTTTTTTVKPTTSTTTTTTYDASSERILQVAFSTTAVPFPEEDPDWNEWQISGGKRFIKSGFKWTDGTQSPIEVLLESTQHVRDNGATYKGSEQYPAHAIRIRTHNSGGIYLQFKGLQPNKRYTVELMDSGYVSGSTKTYSQYSFGGHTRQLLISNNKTTTARFEDIVPTTKGEMFFKVHSGAIAGSSSVGSGLCNFRIIERPDSAPIAPVPHLPQYPIRYASQLDTALHPHINEGDFIITAGNKVETGGISSIVLEATGFSGGSGGMNPLFRKDGVQRKILIKGGVYKDIKLFLVGLEATPEHPVIITNYDGQVKGEILRVYGCRYVEVTGKYDPVKKTGDVNFQGHAQGYAYSGGKYGIWIDHKWRTPKMGEDTEMIYHISSGNYQGDRGSDAEKREATQYQSSFVQTRFIELCNGGFSNQVKAADGLYSGDTMEGMVWEDTYIHDTHGEGIYVGSTQGDRSCIAVQKNADGTDYIVPGTVDDKVCIEWFNHGNTPMMNFTFRNNRILRTGCDGIQFGNLAGNIIIENNVMHGALGWRSPFQTNQDNGVQIGLRGGAVTFRNNIVLHAGGGFHEIFFNNPVAFPRLSDGTPYPTVEGPLILENNVFLHCNGGGGGYLADNSSLPWNSLIIRNNYYGKWQFDYREVYIAKDDVERPASMLLGFFGNFPATITNNTWDGTGNKTRVYDMLPSDGTAVVNGQNVTFTNAPSGKFIGLQPSNPAPNPHGNNKGTVPNIEFENYMDLGTNFNYNNFELWAWSPGLSDQDITTNRAFPYNLTNGSIVSTKGTGLTHKEGDIVMHFSKVYKCILTHKETDWVRSSGRWVRPTSGPLAEPGVTPGWETYWQLQTYSGTKSPYFPPDDVRLKPGSFYQLKGMGLMLPGQTTSTTSTTTDIPTGPETTTTTTTTSTTTTTTAVPTTTTTTTTLAAGVKQLNVNIYYSDSTGAYVNAEWNNWKLGSLQAPLVLTNAKYTDGVASTIDFTLSGLPYTNVDNGAGYLTGQSSSFPIETLRGGFYTTRTEASPGTAPSVTISGLDDTKLYTLYLIGSRSRTYKVVGNFTVDTPEFRSDNNAANFATVVNMEPLDGTITINVLAGATATSTNIYGYLNALRVYETTQGYVEPSTTTTTTVFGQTTTTSTTTTTTIGPSTTTTTTAVPLGIATPRIAVVDQANQFELKFGPTQSLLDSGFTMCGVGSSTLAGTGVSSPFKVSDRISSYLNAKGGVFWNQGAASSSTNDGVPPSVDTESTPHKNILAAVAQNPRAIYVNYPSNDVVTKSNTVQTWVDQTLIIFNYAMSRGIPCFIGSPQPRHDSPATAADQVKLVEASVAMRAAIPPEFYVDTFETLRDPNGATASVLRAEYDSGDHCHLNAEGTLVLFNILKAKLEAYFINRSAIYNQMIVGYKAVAAKGTVPATYDILDTINTTDLDVPSKLYPRLNAGWYAYRTRYRKLDGTFTNYSDPVWHYQPFDRTTVDQTFKLSLNTLAPEASPAGWIDWNADTSIPIGTQRFVTDAMGSAASVTYTVAKVFATAQTGGSALGSLNGNFPNPIPKTGWGVSRSYSDVHQFDITGLSDNHAYEIEFGNGRTSSFDRSIGVLINDGAGWNGNTETNLNTTTVTRNTTFIKGIIPVGGKIKMEVMCGTDLATLTGIILRRYQNGAATTTTTTVAGTTTTTTVPGQPTTTTTTTQAPSTTTTTTLSTSVPLARGKNSEGFNRYFLIDFGGDGIDDGIQNDTGVKTPNNTVGPFGQAADGRWWNNITSAKDAGMVLCESLVDAVNGEESLITITQDKRPGGTYSTSDSSMNYMGSVVAVQDYPSTAVRDSIYFHTSAGIVTWTFNIPSGFEARVLIWGNRSDGATKINRWLQAKRIELEEWKQYNASNNLDYNHGILIDQIFNGGQIQFKVNTTPPNNSTFGHIGIMEIELIRTFG